jgi:hypothetical protein
LGACDEAGPGAALTGWADDEDAVEDADEDEEELDDDFALRDLLLLERELEVLISVVDSDSSDEALRAGGLGDGCDRLAW